MHIRTEQKNQLFFQKGYITLDVVFLISVMLIVIILAALRVTVLKDRHPNAKFLLRAYQSIQDKKGIPENQTDT